MGKGELMLLSFRELKMVSNLILLIFFFLVDVNSIAYAGAQQGFAPYTEPTKKWQ
jgi:hypothetical protein